MDNDHDTQSAHQPTVHGTWTKEEVEAANILIQLGADTWSEDELTAAHALLELQSGILINTPCGNNTSIGQPSSSDATNDDDISESTVLATFELVEQYGLGAVLATFEDMFNEESTTNEEEIVQELATRLKNRNNGGNGQ